MAPPAKALLNKQTDYCEFDPEVKQWWTCDRSGFARKLSAKTGPANAQNTPYRTVHEVFKGAAERFPDKSAFGFEDLHQFEGKVIPSVLPINQWTIVTWKEYYEMARKAAKGFLHFGLTEMDAVCILGFNSVPWAVSAMAATFSGGAFTGIYPTDTREHMHYKADHSNSVVAIVESREHLQEFKDIAEDLPLLNAIVVWDEPGLEEKELNLKTGRKIQILKWDEFLALGGNEPDETLEYRIANLNPHKCAALFYTSGTTSKPKAAMISHDNLMYVPPTAIPASEYFDHLKKGMNFRLLSYLPWSHMAGFLADLITPLFTTSEGKRDVYATVFFARPSDLKAGTLLERLVAVKPHYFVGVPRVWEKMMEKMMAAAGQVKGFKKHLSQFSRKRNLNYHKSRQIGNKPVTPMGMSVANKVAVKVKQRLGFDEVKCFFTGSAPLSKDCFEFFASLGIPIAEGYGLTETTGISTWSNPYRYCWGSIGWEMIGSELKLINPETKQEPNLAKNLFVPTEEEQGELICRGRMIMMGYMANERFGAEHVEEIIQKNKEAIDENGWFYTGDKACKDARGIFRISGRYKEIIISAGGENIAPVPIEDEIKRLCPFISNAVMIGNRKKFNTMLITLCAKGASGLVPGSNELDGSAAHISASKTIEEAMEDPVFIDAIKDAIEKTNHNEEIVVSNPARIQKFTIMPQDFSVQTGELTSTLKLKRFAAEEIHDEIIEKMYASDDVYVKYDGK